MKPPLPSRFLICRLGSLADCIRRLPILSVLRQQLPAARIAWVCEPPAVDFLRVHPQLDQTYCLPAGGMRSPGHWSQLARRLRTFQPDLLLDVQGGWRGWWLSRLAAPLRRLHIGGSDFVRQCEPLHCLGIEDPRPRGLVPVSAAAVQQIASYLRRVHLGNGFAVLQATSAAGNSRAAASGGSWPASWYGRLARLLGQQCQLTSLVLGTDSRRQEEVIASSGGHALPAPVFQLLETAELMRHARLFVGPSELALDLALSASVPALTLSAAVGSHEPLRLVAIDPRNADFERVAQQAKLLVDSSSPAGQHERRFHRAA